MRMVVTALLAFCVLNQSVALVAQSPSGTVAAPAGRDTNAPRQNATLSEAIEREGARQALLPDSGAGSRAQQPGSQSRSWIGRHPALFGALVGAGAGAIMSVTMENELFCSGGDEDCLIHGGGRVIAGAGLGAGVGALIGFVVGLGR